MSETILVEMIRASPSWLLVVILLVFAVSNRRQLGDLISRIGSIKALGLEAEFAQARDQLVQASRSYDIQDVSPEELEPVIRRADRLRDLLTGARVLWVDDQPLANANIYRFLNSYGVVVDYARTTEETITALRWASGAFEVIVSDMVRVNDPEAGMRDAQAGLHLIQAMREQGINKPIILFVGHLDESKPTPLGARAITNRPDELIQHILDVIEQDRA
jgi:CheY-like chemotaxis protein